MKLIQKGPFTFEIPQEGSMRVSGRIFISQELLKEIRQDNSLVQVANVATLPGIVGYSLAMPDIHAGYGFSIGGVAAMDAEEGVISPGGVGYDINCGVRLASTHLTEKEIRPKLPQLVAALYQRIPTGVGSKNAIPKLSPRDMEAVLTKGARWAIEAGFGQGEDLEVIEEKGGFSDVNPETLSQRAKERGSVQLGTVGSGNHFVELSVVDKIYDEKVAQTLGLYPGQVCVMVHSGSRGLGYQVCDDYLRLLRKAVEAYQISLPDRQLACAPIQSPEGQHYLSAMKGAANFAWANRQILMDLARQTLEKTLQLSPKSLGFHLIYDLAHNIVKFEEHEVKGKKRLLAVHRKGATRAFGPNHPALPERYKAIGQPVLLPGDMGRASYVLVGTQEAMEKSFGSSAHGAGRFKSRSQAIREGKHRNISKELESQGIYVLARGKKTLWEEMPEAYKDVSEVARITEGAGLSRRVARLKPMAVIKG